MTSPVLREVLGLVVAVRARTASVLTLLGGLGLLSANPIPTVFDFTLSSGTEHPGNHAPIRCAQIHLPGRDGLHLDLALLDYADERLQLNRPAVQTVGMPGENAAHPALPHVGEHLLVLRSPPA
jgi:hypothetical protein